MEEEEALELGRVYIKQRMEMGLISDEKNNSDKIENAQTDEIESRVKAGEQRNVYRPPGALLSVDAQLASLDPNDKSSEQYQKVTWEMMKKSIHGLINKVNTGNIKEIVLDLFKLNLIRSRGYLARSIMKAQAFSPSFTPVYSSLISIINSKLPIIGELILKRLIIQFRKSYKRNEKLQCTASTTFIAHLINSKVANEILALQLLTLLLENPSDDSVEIAVSFMRQCGYHLSVECSKSSGFIFERFKEILLHDLVDNRVQYLVEDLFKIRKDKFKEFPAVPEELDLVEDEDQITHFISLDDEIDPQEELNDFIFDGNFLQQEAEYQEIRQEILPSEDEAEEEEEENENETVPDSPKKEMQIHDQTGSNLTSLRRTIYLTIMSSVEFEETVHKILKLSIPVGMENEVCMMIAECCSQEKTFLKYYGLVADRLCKLSQLWSANFERSLIQLYQTIHRYEMNQIRNLAKLFAHLLETDAISWSFFDCVQLTEDDTTSSSRIFLKILFQDLNEHYGREKLLDRFHDPKLGDFFGGIFPMNDQQNLRFCINYFTAIGLGYLTDGMRERLDQLVRE